MAIRIDIPGIGPVEVEGISSEETLQRIAAALENSNKGLAKEQKNQANALKDTTKATKDFATGWVAAGDNVIQSFKNLALTATSVATKFFANYDQIAKSPIKAGTAILNTAIDTTTDFVGGLASAVPVIGGFLKGVVDATGALYKLANEALSKQLDKNVEALKEYAKTGIGFTDSMYGMQRVAQLAGMGITEFSQGVTKAKSSLNLLGMSGGDAAERLARNLGQLNKKGPGGLPSLREQIVLMGFSIDEQVDIAAQYMGQQQALGRLEKMSKEELAKGTRDYARDLKVLADFTGKDAKEIRERSRKASQMAILQTTLNEKQLIAFRGAYESLEKLPPEAQEKMQRGLIQSVLGIGVNVEGVTQGPLRDSLESMTDVILKGADDQKSAFKDSANIVARTLNSPETKKYISDLGYSSVSGVSGPTTALIDTLNTARQSITKEGQVDKIITANEKQAAAQDALSVNTAKLATTFVNAQVFVEKKLNQGLAKQSGRVLKGAKVGAIAETSTASMLMGGPQISPSMSALSNEELKSIMMMTGTDPRTGKGLSSKQYKEMLKTGAIPKLDIPEFADGGKLGAGKVGIAGEAGPELVSGPATILSNASYEKLMVALDAMKEKKGVRFGENDFDWTVNMQDRAGYMHGSTQNRMATLKDRTSGFDQFSPKQLMEEMAKRPENADMQRARDAMDDDMGMGKNQVEASKDTSAKMDQTNALLTELVGHMKQNVTQTSRVAMNTN
jgi:hypothetical protein